MMLILNSIMKDFVPRTVPRFFYTLVTYLLSRM